MSRIGRKPIPLPKGVEIKIQNDSVTVRGAKGTLSFDILPNIEVSLDEGRIVVKRVNDDKNVRAAHGMTRAVINNMVQGVSTGFERVLEIIGVGYRAQMQGKNLVLSVGYSHPIEVVPPSGIEFAIDGPTKIIVRGIDKQLVGQTAADIRGHRPPEPYKGKGIRYAGEYVIRKAGKAGGK